MRLNKLIFVLLLLTSISLLSLHLSYALFHNSGFSLNNLFSAAAVFPTGTTGATGSSGPTGPTGPLNIVNHLVINEVYYLVDSKHRLDSPKDRGILGVNGNNVSIQIKDNNTGSTNTVTVSQSQACEIIQSNNTNISGNININTNTGNNISNANTSSNSSASTGSTNSTVNIDIQGSSNNSSDCSGFLGQNDEWVELFNPTDHDISLKNWSLTDNSGILTVIHPDKTVKAHSFALLSKSASTWNFWPPTTALKVDLCSQIGDGLDNSGDHLILKDPLGIEIDRMGWGNDTSGFIPAGTNPVVALGDSTERLIPGFDTDAVSDFHDQNPPTVAN